MVARTTGQAGAIDLLAKLLATLGDVSVDQFTNVEGGVAAEVVLASGDKYLVIVQWSGDAEGEAHA